MTLLAEANLGRNGYGVLVLLDGASPLSMPETLELAMDSGAIPAGYDTIAFDRKGRASGGAVHLEVYDYDISRDVVLLCVRKTVGSKYGVATKSKKYYLLSGSTATQISAAKVHRAIKADGNILGGVVRLLAPLQ